MRRLYDYVRQILTVVSLHNLNFILVVFSSIYCMFSSINFGSYMPALNMS